MFKFIKTAAKRRKESEGIGITRPLCGVQRDGNRKSQETLAFLYEFPGLLSLRQGLGAAAQRLSRRL